MKHRWPNISVIVPFYKGNQYIENLLKNIAVNVEHFADSTAEIEVLFVNDSPEVKIIYNQSIEYPFVIRCISCGKNLGIHGARCYGIRHAKGDYILMLDQDDALSDTWLWEQWKALGSNDIVISNAIYCGRRRKEKKYRTIKEMQAACNKWTLCFEGNKIVSPGQVLIKKQIIPKQWLRHNMKNNGADDYLLWILLFEKNCRISYNLNSFYYHMYSDESVSYRSRLMRKSEEEMVGLLDKYHMISPIRRCIYRRRIGARRHI